VTTTLLKANGKNYLFGTFTNRWIDREGQILTDASHKELIEFLDSHPERAPALWFWHIPEMEFSQKAEWWTYQNGFVSMLWELSTNEAEFVENFSKLFEIGMSHGFVVAEADEAGDITKYRPFEASILPMDKAANINTKIEVLRKEQMNEEKFLAFARTIGSKNAAQLIAQLQEQEAQLEAADIATKEQGEEDPEPVPIPAPTITTVEDTLPDVVEEAEIVAALQDRDAKIDEILANQQAMIERMQGQLNNLTKQLSRAKHNGATRASLAAYRQSLGNGSIIGNVSAQVDPSSELANSQPEQKTNSTKHALSGLWGGN